METMNSSRTDRNMSSESSEPSGVYCITGVDPEVQAYAMAKYSRSALSMTTSLQEISKQRAEEFLNTFYFQYGHRSIADLAHLTFAIERLSMLAAIAVVDEQRWDGQERSSRYQNFRKSGFYIPPIDGSERERYIQLVECLFNTYELTSTEAFKYLAEITPRPSEMAEETYNRTLRARAFDISRYLLPLATNTSLGQIVNARTLENQIARLGSDVHSEVRQIAERLKQSARQPPFDLRFDQIREFVDQLRPVCSPDQLQHLDALLHSEPAAPTLVKYAEPRTYDIERRRELSAAAEALLSGTAIEKAERVTLVRPTHIEIELAATLLYEHSHYSYTQIISLVSGLSSQQRNEIIGIGLHKRGFHDEVSRAFAAGDAFQFDILMDIGGFRDMHRHRRCIQILQPYTALHGYEIPDELSLIGCDTDFRAAVEGCAEYWWDANKQADYADYVLPLAFRRRALFKMDLAEAIYISELRSRPAGHISYRRIAYEMFQAVSTVVPSVKDYVKVHNPSDPTDLLKR